MRLFVALELPGPVTAALAAWGRACAARDRALRPLEPDAMHLTLAFLGERPDDDVEPLRWALAALAPPPVVPLELGAPLWLAPRRPHVLAIAVEDPAGALALLQRHVVAALADASDWRPEPRPFVPHVTVCRVRRGSRPRTERATATRGLEGRPFDPAALALVQSELGDGPPRYTTVERVVLPPAGRIG